MTPTRTTGGSRWWEPLVVFLVRVVLGTAIFAIIAAPAICLDLLAHRFLRPLGLSEVILLGIISAEYAIFGVDLLLFLVFLVSEGWKSAKRLWP
jgi:hypothetical protein